MEKEKINSELVLSKQIKWNKKYKKTKRKDKHGSYEYFQQEQQLCIHEQENYSFHLIFN